MTGCCVLNVWFRVCAGCCVVLPLCSPSRPRSWPPTKPSGSRQRAPAPPPRNTWRRMSCCRRWDTRTHTHTHTHRNRKLLKNKVECLAATDTEFIWTENYQVTSDLKLLEVEIHTWSRVSCRNQLLKVKKHVSAVNVGKTISYCGFNVSSVSYKTHMSCQQDSRNKK